ncbi:exosortase F system-associated membrane protein [Flavobacterium granuli]|uniref:Exosortase F-associated protein n=1 Tax=Flavobacterium granuli TaxID=280093 RepID=A0A1M5N1M0_9FLAO|nr:exosortase F system-associated protein [Flavobacterium granuli]PRZ25160.1 exosortase F-associated protein [Flavobacterium granuli]SHG83466.1 exosortase F-associated protein [Flavobacterium granuli]
MLKILLKHKLKIAFVLMLVFLFALVRAYEDYLFYDPFLNYFKSDFNGMLLPVYDSFQLFFGLLFRYSLNMLISLVLIYTLFEDESMVKFACFLYLFFFLILIICFYVIIYFYGETNNLILFYVRRFLIQPIFVLLFIPAFYYQRLNK